MSREPKKLSSDALAALRATLFREAAPSPSLDAEPADVAFPSYEALAAAAELRPGVAASTAV